ncbi:MAG: hypothetical protein HC887_06035, partial [Desulfobacteraceae bacterium]|nr:hypothetical protein [Desulfobacteraceae bacterium]
MSFIQRGYDITLKGGRIRLQLNDGSILTLASETRLLINQSVYDSDAKSRSSFMGMAVGKARFVVRKIHDALQSDFKIKTQTAVVGVRGSDFIVEADADSTKVVTLNDTRLEIISLADSKMEQTVLTDYEKIMVGHDALPSAVEAVSIEDAKRMIREMDIVPVSPEKLQVNTEKFHHGSQKEIAHAAAEKVKEDVVKAAAVEKTEVNHAITPEKAKSEQADKVETKAVEAVKPDQSQKTEIRTEIQGINTIGLPKAEVSEKMNLKTDIQGAVKDKVVEFVKSEQIEKVEIRTIESPKLEASDIKVFEISKPDTIQQTDTIRAAVADVVRENKEVIQSNVAEIKVLSAQDVSEKAAGTVILENISLSGQNSVVISSPAAGSVPTGSATTQMVIENPVPDDKIVTFTLPSQWKSDQAAGDHCAGSRIRFADASDNNSAKSDKQFERCSASDCIGYRPRRQRFLRIRPSHLYRIPLKQQQWLCLIRQNRQTYRALHRFRQCLIPGMTKPSFTDSSQAATITSS